MKKEKNLTDLACRNLTVILVSGCRREVADQQGSESHQPLNGKSGLDGKGFANSLPLSTETTIAAQ